MAELQTAGGIKHRDFLTRAATGLAYSALVVLILALGEFLPSNLRPLPTGLGFGILAGLAASEFYVIQRREARLPNEFVGIAAAAAMPMAAAFYGLNGLFGVLTSLMVASMVWHTFSLRVRTSDTAVTVFGAMYIGFLLGYFVLIRQLEHGLLLSLTLIFSVWADDVLAFMLGSLIGRHRLAPRISPHKSWEGLLAGSAGAVLVWVFVFAFFDAPFSLIQAIVLAVIVSITSIIGDLMESRMKRDAGVKDSGEALPGHGGFLDRLDSLLLTSLVVYWVLLWMGIS